MLKLKKLFVGWYLARILNLPISNDCKDSEVFEECLSQVEGSLGIVNADGAYDAKNCCEYCEKIRYAS
jgi:hypothetical protein